MKRGNIEKFSSMFEKYTYYIVYHFQFIALIVGFIYLIKNQLFKGAVLILTSTLAMLLYSIVIVSRNDLFQVILIIGVCLILFKKAIPHIIYKKIIKAVCIVGFVFMLFLILISVSRAAYKTDSTWLFEYCGRSVLTFNSFMDYMIHPSNDRTFFFNSDASFAIEHPSYTGTEFLSIFTRLYSDFSYLGFGFCLLTILLYPKSRTLSIADLFIILLIYRIVTIGLMYSTFQFGSMMCFLAVYIMTSLWFHRTGETVSHYKFRYNKKNKHLSNN